MITNGRGTVFSNGDDPFSIAMMQQLIANVYTMRSDLTRSALHSRKDINKECDYPETEQITVRDYQEMFERNPLGNRVVSVMPDECWQVFPEIFEDEDASKLTAFEKAFEEVGDGLRDDESFYDSSDSGNPIWEYLHRLDKLAGIGHFGVILIGIDDGKPLHEPIEGFEEKDSEFIYITNAPKPAGKKHKLLYLSVFSEHSITTIEFNANIHSPRYRKPNYYTLDLGAASTDYITAGREERSVRVHWSRVVHFADNMDSSEIIGTPRQRPVWNNLLDSMKIYGGDAEGYWKNCIMRIFLETHPQLGGEVDIDEDTIRERMWDMENGLQRWAAFMGMSAKTVAPSVTDPSAHIDMQIAGICIQLKMPRRIFEGSERGELASGQDDSTWNDKVRGRRIMVVVPRMVVPFINRLIRIGVLPAPQDKYKLFWEDPENMKPAEKAAIAVSRVDAMSKYIAGQVQTLMDPLDFLTREMDIDEEEATGILERAQEAQEEAKEKQEEEAADQLEQQAKLAEMVGTGEEEPPAEGEPVDEASILNELDELIENAGVGALSKEQLKAMFAKLGYVPTGGGGASPDVKTSGKGKKCWGKECDEPGSKAETPAAAATVAAPKITPAVVSKIADMLKKAKSDPKPAESKAKTIAAIAKGSSTSSGVATKIGDKERDGFISEVSKSPGGKLKLDSKAVENFKKDGDVEKFITNLDQVGGRDNFVGSLRVNSAYAEKYGGIDVDKSPALRDVMSKSKKAADQLGDKGQAAIQEYTTDAYRDVNAALRSGNKMPESGQAMVDSVIKGVDAVGPWKESATIYRGINSDSPKAQSDLLAKIQDHIKSGKVWEEKSIVSTTASPAFAKDWIANSDGGGVVMRIKAKSGMLISTFTGLPGQQEILQKPGTKYKPYKMQEEKHGDKNVTVVDFEEI